MVFCIAFYKSQLSHQNSLAQLKLLKLKPLFTWLKTPKALLYTMAKIIDIKVMD